MGTEFQEKCLQHTYTSQHVHNHDGVEQHEWSNLKCYGFLKMFLSIVVLTQPQPAQRPLPSCQLPAPAELPQHGLTPRGGSSRGAVIAVQGMRVMGQMLHSKAEPLVCKNSHYFLLLCVLFGYWYAQNACYCSLQLF